MPLITKSFNGLNGRVIGVPSLPLDDLQSWEVQCPQIRLQPNKPGFEAMTDADGFRPGIAVQLYDALPRNRSLLCNAQKTAGRDVTLTANNSMARIRWDVLQFWPTGSTASVPPAFDVKIQVGPGCSTDRIFEGIVGGLTSWEEYGSLVLIGNAQGSRVEFWYRLGAAAESFSVSLCVTFDRLGGDGKIRAGSLISMVAFP